ncbi:hypothetical protein JQ615_31305, partial [Bradyrhizobium jicamae]
LRLGPPFFEIFSFANSAQVSGGCTVGHQDPVAVATINHHRQVLIEKGSSIEFVAKLAAPCEQVERDVAGR